MTLITTAITLAFPYFLKKIIDGIQKGLSAKTLFLYCALLFGFGLLRSILSTLLPFLRGKTNEKFAWLCRSYVFSRILNKGYQFSNTFPAGDVIERLDHDLGELSWYACSGIFRPAEAIFTLIITLTILFSISPLLMMLTIAPLSITALFWSKIGGFVYASYRKWREKISLVCSYIESTLSGIKLLKSFNKEVMPRKHFGALLRERIDWAIRLVRSEAKIGIVFQGAGELAILIILIVGGILVIRGKMTLGGFVAFMAYIGLLITPMWDIGNFFVVRKRALVAGRRIRELAEFPWEIGERDFLSPTGKGRFIIKLSDVTFGYEKERTALRNVNLEIREGMKIGIAGTIGSGKTTLMKLLLRLLEPTAGQISIEWVDQEGDNWHSPDNEREAERKSCLTDYRKLFGYCPQEPTLFSDTIFNNITLGRECPKEKVEEVIEISGLKEDIKMMPRGVEQLIGERGMKLSGGQKERVAIARGLLGSPRILILDDATASLDAEIEKEVVNNILKVVKTVIIISHRLSLLQLCDIIYVLDKGEVVELGTHEELLAKRGLYWELYERQLMKEELERAV